MFPIMTIYDMHHGLFVVGDQNIVIEINTD